jgi:hypothetical protein
VCSNTAKTIKDIEDNAANNWDISNPAALSVAAVTFSAQLGIPATGSPAADEVSICSRPWRWEWFAMFFQFAIVASALVVTLMPTRLLRSRYPLAIMFAIATAIIMVSCLQPEHTTPASKLLNHHTLGRQPMTNSSLAYD